MADTETIVLETTKGRVVIALRPDLAPNHVERIKTLAAQGFYDGVPFHRVIDGFMAQTGDPTGTGSGGSDLPDLNAEFNAEPHVRGTCSMAPTKVGSAASTAARSGRASLVATGRPSASSVSVSMPQVTVKT